MLLRYLNIFDFLVIDLFLNIYYPYAKNLKRTDKEILSYNIHLRCKNKRNKD